MSGQSNLDLTSQPNITEVLDDAVNTLGAPATALLIHEEASTIASWRNGHGSSLSESQALVLRSAAKAIDTLATVDGPSVVRAWFLGMNPQMNDDVPAEALAAGRQLEVLAAARAFVNHG